MSFFKHFLFCKKYLTMIIGVKFHIANYVCFLVNLVCFSLLAICRTMWVSLDDFEYGVCVSCVLWRNVRFQSIPYRYISICEICDWEFLHLHCNTDNGFRSCAYGKTVVGKVLGNCPCLQANISWQAVSTNPGWSFQVLNQSKYFSPYIYLCLLQLQHTNCVLLISSWTESSFFLFAQFKPLW